MGSKIKSLVIGANGFIGSHLVDELVSKGHLVYALDRFNSDEQFDPSDEIIRIRDDLSNFENLKSTLKNVDYVFHCISATTPYSSDKDPYTDIELNLKRSVIIFELCSKEDIKKVIFISSGGAIYGHIAELKYATEDDVATPVSPYGICKLATEHYLAYFNRMTNLDYCAIRLTNPYGPRQHTKNNQGVIPAFLSNIYKEEPLEIYGDGTSSRDYIFIRDATRLIVESSMKKMKYKTYNLGSGKQTTVNEIVDILRNKTNKDIIVNYKEPLKTFLKSSKVSITRFEEEFGLISSIRSLNDGIEQTVSSFLD